ncbi:glycoside hydrolase superfamily [Obelidium mucronatum]|nr:glycoside hydrolase superfamily [Obelidium mucronatum]
MKMVLVPLVAVGLIPILCSAQSSSSSTTVPIATTVTAAPVATTAAPTSAPVVPVGPVAPIVVPVPGPTSSKLTIGTWFWYSDHSPASWNAKMGYKYGSFQTETSVPYALTPDGTSVILDQPSDEPNFMRDPFRWDDGTNASIFLTVYANYQLKNGTFGLDLVTDEGLVALANRLSRYHKETGREVYVRWCPEMNGEWFLYGPPTSPVYFVQVWRQMATIVKRIAPNTKLVWSPNFDLKPGNTAYWPGADYVDVVGTSVYYKGFGSNPSIPLSYAADSIATVYNEYAAPYNKPFVISEASGGWEVGVSSSVDQATFQSQFWAGILSTDFLNRFPLVEGVQIFDFLKQEEFMRDFRVSNDTAVRNEFNRLVEPLSAQGVIKWATSKSDVKPTTTVAGVATVVTTSRSGAVQLISGLFAAAVGVFFAM